MPEWVSISRLIDWIFVGLLMELGWLLLIFWKNRSKSRVLAVMILNGASGACLLLALSWSQQNSPPVHLALALSGAGAFHTLCLLMAFSHQNASIE